MRGAFDSSVKKSMQASRKWVLWVV
jgi:hypothetical protein